MKIKQIIPIALLAATMLGACNNDESYSDRLNSERYATNAYLRDQRVINDIPDDTVFETGTNAPFYRIDPEGNVYMQVLNPGNRAEDTPKASQKIYFRFTRYNLLSWYSSGVLEVVGSNEYYMDSEPTFFLYKDFTLPQSSQWGYGIQLPMALLGVECEVNLIIKSQYGWTSEIAYVQPYLYHLRYFHSQI